MSESKSTFYANDSDLSENCTDTDEPYLVLYHVKQIRLGMLVSRDKLRVVQVIVQDK